MTHYVLSFEGTTLELTSCYVHFGTRHGLLQGLKKPPFMPDPGLVPSDPIRYYNLSMPASVM
jgi:hypothetical protein